MKKTSLVTLCCTVLMAQGATLDLSSSSLNLTGVSTFSATASTALSVDANVAGNVLVVGTFSTEASSTTGEGSWQLKATSETSTPIKRTFINKKSIGIASVVHVFTGVAADESIALQHSSSAGATITTKGVNLVAIPLSVVSTAQSLNYGLHQQTTTNSITSTNFITTDIKTSVALPLATGNRLYMAASFNSQTTANSFPAIGTWQLQYKKSTDALWTATGSQIRRTMNIASDKGAITLYGLVEDLSQGTYEVQVVCKSDDGKTIQTLNGTLAAVALSYADGAGGGYFDGFSVDATTLNRAGTTTPDGAKGTLTLASAGGIFASMNFTGLPTTGANQTAAFDLSTTVTQSTLLGSGNQENERFFEDTSDFGSGGSVGYFSGLAAGDRSIYGRYENTTGPVTVTPVTLVGFATLADTVSGVPSAPTDLAATVNGQDISLTWTDTSDNEVGFYIYQSKDGGAYSLIHTTSADVEAYTVGTPGVGSYLFKVSAYNAVGESSTVVTPTSSGIELRAFQAAEGVVVEFVAYDVEAEGVIELQLIGDDGNLVWSGSVDVTEGPRFFARFVVPGLELGQSYNFRVRDEVGNWWNTYNVIVEPFAAKMTSAKLENVVLSFDSLPQRTYDIQWCTSLGEVWQTVTNVTAESSQTSVVVPYSGESNDAGFFRIQLK